MAQGDTVTAPHVAGLQEALAAAAAEIHVPHPEDQFRLRETISEDEQADREQGRHDGTAWAREIATNRELDMVLDAASLDEITAILPQPWSSGQTARPLPPSSIRAVQGVTG